MDVERGTRAVVRSAVQVVKVSGAELVHRGQGLLLTFPEGAFVLTCHHVIAPLSRGELHVRLREGGALGAPIPATYIDTFSHPGMDAAVLRLSELDDEAGSRPLLHAPADPITFRGPLAVTAFGYGDTGLPQKIHGDAVSCEQPFSIETRPRPSLVDPCCPDVPGNSYAPPYVIRVIGATGARKGISGSVAVCEDGVIGLVHFAVAETETTGRTNYVVPLTAWTETWPELARWVVPFEEKASADRLNGAAASCLGSLRAIRDAPNSQSFNDEKWALGDLYKTYRQTLRAYPREGIYERHARIVSAIASVRFLLQEGSAEQVEPVIAELRDVLARFGWSSQTRLEDEVEECRLRLSGMLSGLERGDEDGAGICEHEKWYLGEELPRYRDALRQHPDEAVYLRHAAMEASVRTRITERPNNPTAEEVKKALEGLAVNF